MFFASRPRYRAQCHRLDEIDLNADQLLAGIVYHLVDEGLAAELDEDSVRSTYDRLAREIVRGSIHRRMWGAMTNVQRLTWLLLRARTMIVIDAHGRAVLETAHASWPPVLIARRVRSTECPRPREAGPTQ